MMTMQLANQRQDFLQQLFADPTQTQKLLSQINVPDAVAEFVGQLQILKSIPSHYLVPAAKMLPKESIRFFHVDKNWVNALIDGAYSISRASELDQQQDAACLNALFAAAWSWIKQSRPEAANACATQPITGFVLRSAVVQHYPSMQVHTYSGGTATAPTDELSLIRLDHLADDTLMGLFSGTFKYLALSKPPEMLHLGFETQGCAHPLNSYKNPTLYINLRSLTDPVGSETGQCIAWGTDANRRVHISLLAETLKSALKAQTMTSAEFAVEMTHGADTVVLINQSFGS